MRYVKIKNVSTDKILSVAKLYVNVFLSWLSPNFSLLVPMAIGIHFSLAIGGTPLPNFFSKNRQKIGNMLIINKMYNNKNGGTAKKMAESAKRSRFLAVKCMLFFAGQDDLKWKESSDNILTCGKVMMKCPSLKGSLPELMFIQAGIKRRAEIPKLLFISSQTL